MRRFLLFLFGVIFMGFPVFGTLFAKLARNIGAGGLYIAEGTVAGPASYAAGGFTVDLEMATVTRYVIQVDDQRIGAADDFVRAFSHSEAAGVITILVRQQQLSATNTWAEIADTTDISAQSFRIIAVGEP